MPSYLRRKKTYRKKRGATTRRPTNFNTKNKLTPSVYPFTRTFEQLLALEAPVSFFHATLTDNLVVGHVEINLSELPGYAEFQTLFAQYKINALSLKVTPSYQMDMAANPLLSGQTIICSIWKSTHGQAPTTAFTISDLLQIQKRKEFIMPRTRPMTHHMRLTQLGQVYGAGVTTTDYVKIKPRYISTTESSTPHYGLNFCFRAPDGAALTASSPRLLLQFKAKMTMKQAK